MDFSHALKPTFQSLDALKKEHLPAQRVSECLWEARENWGIWRQRAASSRATSSLRRAVRFLLIILPDISRNLCRSIMLDPLQSFFSVEECCCLFKSKALRFDDVQAAENEFKRNPTAVHDLLFCASAIDSSDCNTTQTHVIFPTEFAKCDWIYLDESQEMKSKPFKTTHILVEDDRKWDWELLYHKTFGSNGVRKNFDGVRHNEGGESNTKGEECQAMADTMQKTRLTRKQRRRGRWKRWRRELRIDSHVARKEPSIWFEVWRKWACPRMKR